MWRVAMNNPDYKMYPHVYNLIAQKGQHMPPYFNVLIDPLRLRSGGEKERGGIRRHQGADLHRLRLVRLHLQDPPATAASISSTTSRRRRSCCSPARRIWSGRSTPSTTRSCAGTIIWLKGMNTGIMDEPPVRYWVMGANEWRSANNWPLPDAQWTKFYLSSWERLSPDLPEPSSATETQPPDVFVQMPPTQTTTIQRLRYMTDPLPHDVLVAGPIVVTLYAVDRSGRHQLDRDPQGRRPRRVGEDRARRRARSADKSARARDDPRLAQGLAPRARREALKAVVAVASADARGAKAGDARRNRGIPNRDTGDGQSVSPRPPHLPRHHLSRPADRRRRRDQRRIRAVPHLLAARRCCTWSFTTASILRTCCCPWSRRKARPESQAAISFLVSFAP